MNFSPERGLGLLESLVALAVAAVVATAVWPFVGRWVERERLGGATRDLAVDLQAARWRALAEGRSWGLRLQHAPGKSLSWQLHRDGDGDGLRSADMDDGTDPPLSRVVALADRRPGIRAGFPDIGPVRRIPPQTGWISGLHDPVKFGRSDIVSFSPTGGATSGSIYLTDGRRLTALVLNGITGRLRLFAYTNETMNWKELN